ncbi:hypothetical protein EWF20_06110 [Sulfolobus sp. S-194]|uniref:hypothetical protein n=1 Tax=Sulfolobus sp. S-194 TaxID=2512240 RepID=UPI0014372446|nr:hypothetical protein [Sulfolobus sp. S-194]QIW23772.1 hypothetical protein EWF20_06110 [Sulfolobus sp. S-194]
MKLRKNGVIYVKVKLFSNFLTFEKINNWGSFILFLAAESAASDSPIYIYLGILLIPTFAALFLLLVDSTAAMYASRVNVTRNIVYKIRSDGWAKAPNRNNWGIVEKNMY